MYLRSETKKVKVGNTHIGGDNYVSVQSMLNVKANDFLGNVNQAVELEKAGCEIVRVTVPNLETVPLIPLIKEKINIPLVADIHFDYKVAIAAAEAGVDKIRINPGNIGSDEGVKKVVEACKKRNIPIRIGVNSGSIEKEILAKYGVTARALFESGKYHISLLENFLLWGVELLELDLFNKLEINIQQLKINGCIVQ